MGDDTDEGVAPVAAPGRKTRELHSKDDGDALTYSLSGTDADDFTIDEDSGVDVPTDANGDNVYEVNLSGVGNTATQELTFNVTDDTDEAPVITSSSSTEVEENRAPLHSNSQR